MSDMALTLRTLATEYGLSLAELRTLLELSEANNPPDVPLRPRVVTVFRLTLASKGRRTFDAPTLAEAEAVAGLVLR